MPPGKQEHAERAAQGWDALLTNRESILHSILWPNPVDGAGSCENWTPNLGTLYLSSQALDFGSSANEFK